ncbi:uncharacterized protein LOC121046817 [Ixodes scapularis]|uniref:uncharacterized protein LOC121046817 n=2 Tax=Ixodes scapularis TaxID=6945 RepID=UPI001C37E906|nr:uncharacterized protein LOC121046817 [Ixodes scapularis]
MHRSNAVCILVQILASLFFLRRWSPLLQPVIVTPSANNQVLLGFPDNIVGGPFGAPADWPQPQRVFTPFERVYASTSTSSLTDGLALKPWSALGCFSGHGNSLGMHRSNAVCILVQILASLFFLRRWSPLLQPVIVTPSANNQVLLGFPDNIVGGPFGAPADWPQPQRVFTPFERVYASTSTSSLTDGLALKPWSALGCFSGHGNSLGMHRSNAVCILVQVGSVPSLHAKKTNNHCLLLFPCPSVFFALLLECLDVLRSLLLLSGDVELNPGPMTVAQATQLDDVCKLLQDLNARAIKSQEGQSSLIKTVEEIKKNQQSIEAKINEFGSRLLLVESKISALEIVDHDFQEMQGVAEALQNNNVNLLERLNELEDRSRRDNLIIHGLPDVASETWAESETKVLELISRSLQLQVTPDCIERAHRIGSFNPTRCRPLVIKFSSFKVKDKVLFSRLKLKGSTTYITEDFSPATRIARKKLIEFGKATNCIYQLRYNKLHVNKKCYMYNATTDNVFEFGSAPDVRARDNTEIVPTNLTSASS